MPVCPQPWPHMTSGGRQTCQLCGKPYSARRGTWGRKFPRDLPHFSSDSSVPPSSCSNMTPLERLQFLMRGAPEFLLSPMPRGLKFKPYRLKATFQTGCKSTHPFLWDAVAGPPKIHFLHIKSVSVQQLPFTEDLLCASHCASFMSTAFTPHPAP